MSRTSDYERCVVIAENTLNSVMCATHSSLFPLELASDEISEWAGIYIAAREARIELDYMHSALAFGHA